MTQFIQIVSLANSGVTVTYREEDGALTESPILLAGLDKSGGIHLLDFVDDGVADDVTELENFVRINVAKR